MRVLARVSDAVASNQRDNCISQHSNASVGDRNAEGILCRPECDAGGDSRRLQQTVGSLTSAGET